MEHSFENEVLTRLTKIETKLDDYSKNKEKTDDAYNLSKENEKDIADINEKIKWITRTIAGAVIAGIIGIAISLVKTGAGMP
ncbi:MAG: hemolysin XhlA family protein [Clostridia bacterium]|nr:hemolysin XhlA family protein [Clostridia bacterium]